MKPIADNHPYTSYQYRLNSRSYGDANALTEVIGDSGPPTRGNRISPSPYRTPGFANPPDFAALSATPFMDAILLKKNW